MKLRIPRKIVKMESSDSESEQNLNSQNNNNNSDSSNIDERSKSALTMVSFENFSHSIQTISNDNTFMNKNIVK